LFGILENLSTTAFVLDTTTIALAVAPLFLPGAYRTVMGLTMRERILCAGAALIALYGMSTNNDFKMTDLPPLLVAIFIPVALGGSRSSEKRPASFRLEPAAVTAIIGIGLVVGMTRLTLSGNAGRVFGSGPLFPAGSEGTFFARLAAGPRLAAIERDLTAITANIGVRRSDVFFGPALEFGYAAHGYVPPTGLPIWWHPGTSYAREQSGEIATRFVANAPAIAVFLLDDWQGMPSQIYAHLRAHYTRKIVGTLMVFERHAATATR
jgi:hypothetical protein